MSASIAINGFGRIGRAFFRRVIRHESIDVVAINDLAPTKVLAHLLKYDSVHGRFPGEVKACKDSIVVDGKTIPVFHVIDPRQAPWGKLGVWGVLEATGYRKDEAFIRGHLSAGASKVVLSANPCGEEERKQIHTLVMGLNHRSYRPKKHHLVSNASCTTNCLAPILDLLDRRFTIAQGMFTTVHSYTGDQRILDGPHEDLCRARAAAANIIPTTTGATKGVEALFPHLHGKLSGISIRVPTPNVSLIDLTVVLKKKVTAEQINRLMKQAAKGRWKPYLEYVDDPVVSSDIIGSTASAVFDAGQTRLAGNGGPKGNMLKILLWYDNEIGYAARLADLITHMIEKEN